MPGDVSREDRLLHMLMDAVNQGAPHCWNEDHTRQTDQVWHGYISAWEDILPELIAMGVAEGDPAKGVTILWDRSDYSDPQIYREMFGGNK